MAEAARRPAFVARLALMALRRESPLDVFGHLRGMRRGGRRVLDLKLRGGAQPDNLVPLAELTPLERRWLRDLFWLLDIARQSVRLHLQSDLRS